MQTAPDTALSALSRSLADCSEADQDQLRRQKQPFTVHVYGKLEAEALVSFMHDLVIHGCMSGCMKSVNAQEPGQGGITEVMAKRAEREGSE